MDINDRVRLFMEYKGLSSSDFAERAGIQASTFSHFLNGRNKASLEVMMKIDQAFKEVRFDWLLYGEGEMLHSISHPSSSSVNLFTDNTITNPPNEGAPAQPASVASLQGVIAASNFSNYPQQLTPPAEPIKPPRKITEIRVFFSDNTYEIFKADK